MTSRRQQVKNAVTHGCVFSKLKDNGRLECFVINVVIKGV